MKSILVTETFLKGIDAEDIHVIYLQSECIVKRTSLSYVQNMIEDMVLTSYLDKSNFVAS